MTTERKQWWRKVAAVAVGGGVVAGGLFGIVQVTAQPEKAPVVENAAWTRSAAPAPAAPSVAEVERSATPPGGIVQAGATLPIPLPLNHVAVPAPAAPLVPVPPFPPGLEPPAAGPRAPDAGLVNPDKNALPAVPPLPGVELPKVPALPSAPALPMDAKPIVPLVAAPPMDPKPLLPPLDVVPNLPQVPSAPGVLPLTPPAPPGVTPLPPLPGATVEPPKAPALPAAPYTPPMMPGTPVPPEPVKTAPSLPPFKLTEPAQPLPPVKPDSGLNPIVPGNTLNPASPVAPAVPIAFPPTSPGGREVPGKTVDRAKPTEPSFGATDKFVFPVPATNQPPSLTPRESAMLNLKHTAALAVLGGALLTAENARAAALFPPIVPAVPAVPAAPVKADVDTDKLKDDLKEANKKIAALEKQVAKLTELLTGKKDELGLAVPSDPGAVAEIKRLTDQVKTLDTELKALKTQTALKPAIVPEVKPKGIVKVVNEYPVEISMVINEKSHRIAPNTKIEVEVPAGDFSYQLLQSGAAATRSVIKDKETVTLRIK